MTGGSHSIPPVEVACYSKAAQTEADEATNTADEVEDADEADIKPSSEGNIPEAGMPDAEVSVGSRESKGDIR